MGKASAQLRTAPRAQAAVAALLLAGAATTAGPLEGRAWTAPVRLPSLPAVDPGIDPTPDRPERVVVTAQPGRAAEAASTAAAAGARVGESLPIVDGFQAEVDDRALAALAASTAVRAVTLDRKGTFQSLTFDELTTASPYVQATGASTAWAGGLTGEGVNVAVIDSGISNMPDLAGRVVWGPDLSGERTQVDTYGHGTVMGSIIAGDGADSASTGRRTGIAPRAGLVAVKAAGRNGAVDVSQVLQAMHWVSAYKDAYKIRVLNLSYGTQSTQDIAHDPLNHAVQRLWQQGIVVVVAAGNSGPHQGSITKPGDDPMVITAGAYADGGNADPADDSIPSWTSRGPTAHGVAKPDLVAPGRTLIAQRAHGSQVVADNPKSLISPSYIKGSGSSQAAAVTSGLAALVLQARPDWTPDQVKRALVSTARPIAGAPAGSQGAGRAVLGAALAADPGPAHQQAATSSGLGSIEGARGSGPRLQVDCGADGTLEVVQGEIDAYCGRWDPVGFAGGAWTGGAWTGGAWTGGAWTGGAWTGGAWTGGAWTGGAWTGAGYGDDEVLLTAWWGNHPRRWQRIPGERPDPADRQLLHRVA